MNPYLTTFLALSLLGCGANPDTFESSPETATSIIGGKDTTKSNILSKYVVLIYDNPTKNFCTGVLISKNVVLTAAHCIGASPKDLTLAFGLKPLTGDYILRQAAKTLPHELYKKSNSDRNDIALILVKGNAPTGFQTVLLPDHNFPLQSGYTFTATGYGRISGKKSQLSEPQGSGYLRHVDLQIEAFSPSENQFIINQQKGKGICNGDSGGPALMRYLGKDYVVGVASAISWSTAEPANENKDICSEKSIYISIKKYRSWIDDNLKKLLN